MKKVAGGVTTVYLYDAQGWLAAEYGGAAAAGTRYVREDHLGSTRVVTDGTGAAVGWDIFVGSHKKRGIIYFTTMTLKTKEI